MDYKEQKVKAAIRESLVKFLGEIAKESGNPYSIVELQEFHGPMMNKITDETYEQVKKVS